MNNWKFTPDSNAGLFISEATQESRANALDGILTPDRFSTTEHPKLKFNFTFEIEYRGDYTPVGSPTMAGLAIPLKHATRPNPTINLVDVNYYNYRTKVATKVDWGTCTLTFYDDAANLAHDLAEQLISDISRIPQVDVKNKALLDNPSSIPFGELSTIDSQFDNNLRTGVIRLLRLNHFYVLHGKLNVATYNLINPRLASLDYGDLDMTQSDVTTVAITLAYDGYTVEYNRQEAFGQVGAVERVA